MKSLEKGQYIRVSYDGYWMILRILKVDMRKEFPYKCEVIHSTLEDKEGYSTGIDWWILNKKLNLEKVYGNKDEVMVDII